MWRLGEQEKAASGREEAKGWLVAAACRLPAFLVAVAPRWGATGHRLPWGQCPNLCRGLCVEVLAQGTLPKGGPCTGVPQHGGVWAAPWQVLRVPMSPQTSQGVQVRRFKTLSELIALYLQPNQGLVCTLLFPVERDKDKDNAEDRDYSGMGVGVSPRWGPGTPGPAVGAVTNPPIAPLQMERMKSRHCHHALAPPASPAPRWGSVPLAWGRRGRQRGEGTSPACPCPIPVRPQLLIRLPLTPAPTV